MFKKLHNISDDSQFSMSQDKKASQITYKKNFHKDNEKKKQSSYGQKFRKKNHLLPTLPNIEIFQSDTFIFQGIHHFIKGRLASIVEGSSLIPSDTEKHGEGVMFLKNGTTIIGTWDHGFLNGKALIFTPFGGKTIAQFYNGKLNGWAITIFAEKLVVCAIYYENRIDGEKIIFQMNQKMWVGSKYVQETKSFKIIHLQKGNINQLPDFIKLSQATQLIDLYECFINNEDNCLNLREIQFVRLTDSLDYIGFCNEQGYPNGLGCIYGKKQFYMGHFREGSLQCYGRMIFENGEIYHGQLLNGVFYGQGTYYNPSKNLSTIMSTTRDEQKILDEHQGYICINSSLNYFRFSKQSSTGMIGDSLASITQIIEKYYSRYFIEKKYDHVDSYSAHSEFGISQNADDIQQLNLMNQKSQFRKSQHSDQTKKQSSQQKPWLNFKPTPTQSIDQTNKYSKNQVSQQQFQVRTQRAYSMDKRQAAYNRKNLAEKSIPANFLQIKQNSNLHEDQSLDLEISKLQINRNLSLKEKREHNVDFYEATKAKQNVEPYQRKEIRTTQNLNELQITTKRNNLGIGEKSSMPVGSDTLTFRNMRIPSNQTIEMSEYRNERKYSQLVESNANFSPQQSVISDLSHKVEKMVKRTSTKRKKIFM